MFGVAKHIGGLPEKVITKVRDFQNSGKRYLKNENQDKKG